MPTYHEAMTTHLSSLTSAADKWDDMAGEFKKLEEVYERDVSKIASGQTWRGLAATAANDRFKITLREYQAAQKESKAIAALLRDAHTQFADLRGRLKSVRADAIKNGMRVSEEGVVAFDTEQLSDASRTAYHHDPDYQAAARKAEGEWNEAIKAAVQAINDADDAVKIALEAVVLDTDLTDGTLNGFNRNAKTTIDAYTPEQSSDATQVDGWVSDGKASFTGPDTSFSAKGPAYGKEGSVKAAADLFHGTAEGSLTNGQMKLSGIADGYGGARATANFGITESGVVGKAEASVGARVLTEGRAEYGNYGTYVRGEGFAGAEAAANLKVTKDEVTIGGKAFAGAKAGAAGGIEVGGIGVGGTAEAWAGPGAEAWFGWKKDKETGVWSIGGDAGLSPGTGGKLGLEITIDPDKVAKTAVEVADAVGVDDAVDFVSGIFD